MNINLSDPNINFWELHPFLKIIEPFKSLYKEDKTKTKTTSSQMMYFVAYVNDISKANPFRHLGHEDKIQELCKSFIEEDKYYDKNKEKIEQLSEMYIECTDTMALKSLREWSDKIKDRSTFIKSVKYSLATADQLDKMMGMTKKLYDDYSRIMKDLTSDADSNNMGKGGTALSASDMGDI